MSLKKPLAEKLICSNKKARLLYFIEETFEAGIVLTGDEVKALRDGDANLTDAFAFIQNGEVWLKNFHISPYSHRSHNPQEPLRNRKLLLHGAEIRRIVGQINEKGRALIPLKVYFSTRGIAKVEVALATGKKLHDKRQDLIEKDAKREISRAMKNQRED